MEEIEFSWWLFEGRPRQSKNVLPDGLNWLCYFAGSSKSHRENSISCIFLESPHQVDLKNVVKCYKHFFGYFNGLKTHCVLMHTNFKSYSLKVAMALDVKEKLLNIFISRGQMNHEESLSTIQQMRRTGRLMEEYFG